VIALRQPKLGGLGILLLLVAALGIALITWGLAPALCGENSPLSSCGATSSPILAIIFAWTGLAGVVVGLLLVRVGWRRATSTVVLLTAAVYVAWLIAFALELRELTDERGYRSRTSALPSSPVLTTYPADSRPST
jgi:hypothetical protein